LHLNNKKIIQQLSFNWTQGMPLLLPLVAGVLMVFSTLVAAGMIEEVQVYGTKKNHAVDVQDVPGMISVFNAGMLDSIKFTTLEDLSFAAPNVNLEQVGTLVGVQNFSIRGLGVNTSIPSIDPSVGVFVDGVYLGVIYGAVADTFDIDSIEILRGPQSLLFGRNVTGGAILLRSKRPDGKFHTMARAGIETGVQTTVSASIEAPVYNTGLAARLSAYYRNDDGYFENLATPGRDVGRQESMIIRPVLTYTPSDRFDGTIIYEHGDITGDGATPQRVTNRAGIATNIDTNINTVGSADLSWDQFTLETNIRLGNGGFTNIFGWRRFSQTAVSDIDASPLPLFDGGNNLEQEQFSNEIRYAGRVTDAWEVIGGLYYFNQDMNYRESRLLLGNTLALAGGGVQEHENLGVFAANDFILNSSITIMAGLRYTYESKTAGVTRLGRCNVMTLECPADFSDARDWSNLAPKFGIKWTVNNDLMIYSHWTRSFRSGGYNFRSTAPDILPPGPTREELQDSFEIGVKSAYAPGFRFNIAGFVNLLEGLQREITVADPVFGLVQGVLNTADATIAGFEIDTALAVSDGLVLNGAMGYLDSDYSNIRYDLNEDGVIDGADKALRIPRLAQWTLTVGAGYTRPAGGYGTLNIRADYSYRSDAAMTDNNFSILPSFHVVNAGAEFTDKSGHWTLSAYAKNLTDEAIFQADIPLPFAALGAPRFTPLQKGRRFGVEVRYGY
jgi:iron complex outermembrane receptor protein